MSDAILTVEADPARVRALILGSLAGFDAVSFRVTGDCMRPTLAPGDIVRVAGVDRRRPRFGDVVLVATGEGLRLHRLVWRLPLVFSRWRTKGDRAAGFDGPLSPERALGTVLGVEDPRGLRSAFSPFRALSSLLRGIASRAHRVWLGA